MCFAYFIILHNFIYVFLFHSDNVWGVLPTRSSFHRRQTIRSTYYTLQTLAPKRKRFVYKHLKPINTSYTIVPEGLSLIVEVIVCIQTGLKVQLYNVRYHTLDLVNTCKQIFLEWRHILHHTNLWWIIYGLINRIIVVF